jgi:predicted nucleic acid-binding protein
LSRFVLDAFVALRWFLDNPLPAYANRVKQLLIKGDRALVPALWHLEMSNGLAVAERHSILSRGDVDLALLNLEQLVARAIDTNSTLVPARQSLSTARTLELPAYDTAYLDLARREKVPLASLDQRLRAAAKRARVPLVR